MGPWRHSLSFAQIFMFMAEAYRLHKLFSHLCDVRYVAFCVVLCIYCWFCSIFGQSVRVCWIFRPFRCILLENFIFGNQVPEKFSCFICWFWRAYEMRFQKVVEVHKNESIGNWKKQHSFNSNKCLKPSIAYVHTHVSYGSLTKSHSAFLQ